MQKKIKYTIFKTRWGYFGLIAMNDGLLRTCLPLAMREKVKSHLLQNLAAAQYDKGLFKTVQEQVTAYFEGAFIDFRNIPVVLVGLSYFTSSVLTACREIGFGQTISYAGLAKKAGRPSAYRAVGRALSRNSLPLIIPCHRVICNDGKIGGFSSAGGRSLKEKLLKHEYQTLT